VEITEFVSDKGAKPKVSQILLSNYIIYDTVAYRPVAERWLCELQLLLGNARTDRRMGPPRGSLARTPDLLSAVQLSEVN
jgi:hypothetical protein